MLALSSMLDLRRAALNARRADRVIIALPGAQALPDDESHITAAAPEPAHPADGAAVADAAAQEDFSKNRSSGDKRSPVVPPLDSPQLSHPEASNPQPAAGPDRKLSEQELKDDVAQLIAHVDQEAAANTTASDVAPGSSVENAPVPVSPTKGSEASSDTVTKTATVASSTSAGVAVAAPDAGAAHPISNTTTEDVVASAEELFAAAQMRVGAMSTNATLKPLLGVDELRTLHALALQGTRGDCEQATDPRGGGSLFKTDAEAAGTDVEKTDPLWGAWCMFSGRYRSDAMRDFVARAHALQVRLDSRVAEAAAAADTDSARAADADLGAASGNETGAHAFDQHAASLDDVLTPEEQTALRAKAELVLPHLGENDVRFLAALSLQATLGDCAPYLRVATKPDSGPDPDQRALTEPLLGHTAVKGEGALWGAWCVLQRHKRKDSAARLSVRVQLLLDQLSQKLAPHAGTPPPSIAPITAVVDAARHR